MEGWEGGEEGRSGDFRCVVSLLQDNSSCTFIRSLRHEATSTNLSVSASVRSLLSANLFSEHLFGSVSKMYKNIIKNWSYWTNYNLIRRRIPAVIGFALQFVPSQPAHTSVPSHMLIHPFRHTCSHLLRLKRKENDSRRKHREKRCDVMIWRDEMIWMIL